MDSRNYTGGDSRDARPKRVLGGKERLQIIDRLNECLTYSSPLCVSEFSNYRVLQIRTDH